MGIRTRFIGLGDAYKAFADRQLKPLLRGMDADRASAEEIEGLAWGGNNLRGGNVRNSETQQFPDDFSPEQTRLHRETIPAGGWTTQAPVSNEQPNILGRLLVSDLDDEVANRLLNDADFTGALGTTPAELQAIRNRINDAVELGAGIQGRNLDELSEQGITSVSEAGNLLRLRDEVRANPSNQSVSRLLDEMRNPRIKQVKATPVFDDGDLDAPLPARRAGLVETKQPQTFGEYQQLKKKQEGRLRNALRKDGRSTEEIDAFIRDNPNPNLPDLDEATFNEIRQTLGDSPFNLGMEIERGIERQMPDRGEADRVEDVFLSDFLTKKLAVSPDTLELASASGSPAVKQRAQQLQAQQQLFDEIGFGDGADRRQMDIWEDDGRALGQMRDAVIGAEDIGGRATDILKADELSRQRTVLERMKGGEKVRIKDPWTGQMDSGMLDRDVAKFVRELEDIQGTARNPEELRSLIDLKVAELNASRPDVVEAGLRFIDSQQLKQGKTKGGGRKTASKVLSKADRAGMNVPLLSEEARQTYRQFVNPNNPLNLGTPVIAVGAGTLATAGALLVDAMKQEEIDNYASSMAKQQAQDTLRKADPAVLVMAIENAGWY